MSFYFGFAKNKYDGSIREDTDVYFDWCGRENYDFYRALCSLGVPHLCCEDEWGSYHEYEVPVEKLDFISHLYWQITSNENYNIIMKLCRFDDNFVEEYIDNLSIKEKAELRLAFLLDTDDPNIENIGIELFNRMEYGYNIISALYEGYQKMLAEEVETVWVFGG